MMGIEDKLNELRIEDKSNEWSTEDKLNVLSTAVSYASPSQGFHSLFGSFIEESFDGFHFLFRRQIERVEHRRQIERLGFIFSLEDKSKPTQTPPTRPTMY